MKSLLSLLMFHDSGAIAGHSLNIYSTAQIKLPVNFNPPYLNLILMEMRIQQFLALLAILFPMVPDFAQIDEKKVKFELF